MRIEELKRIARRRRLDRLLIMNPANVRAFTGVNCDNAIVALDRTRDADGFRLDFYTDFRYIPMVHRVAPRLNCRDIRWFWKPLCGERVVRRVGYEAIITHQRFLELQKRHPRATFVDDTADLAAVRSVKTTDEIAAIRAAERLACEIWNDASARFRAGMTERGMARIIQKLIIERGEGEAFSTIVCVGRNAAECHHEPDDTVWNGREPVLVDMGVRLGGVCSDLTRNLVPGFLEPSRPLKSVRTSRLYRQVYALVLKANRTAIAAARPGMTGKALDAVARKVIREGGFGRCFWHSLGHGVGYEIHEAPTAGRKSDIVLKPGMLVTIEPGIYLEGNLGVRIEDLVLITETGCEVLSDLAAK